jgi:hypothetical protein
MVQLQLLVKLLASYPTMLTMYLGNAVHVENMNRRQALMLAHA